MTPLQSLRICGARGVKLAADVGGPADAPTVILSHGGGQTRHSWDATMRRLITAGFRVINVDTRGHGDSDWAPDGDYSTPIQADDVMAVVGVAGDRVALVGASMGGLASFYAVGRFRPPAVRALVLVDIVLKPALDGVERVRTFMRAFSRGFISIDAAAEAIAAYYPGRPRPASTAGLMKNLRLREDGRLYWHWDPRLLISSAETDAQRSTEWLPGVARDVTIPTLLLRGARSDVVDDAGVADMLALVPHTEVHDVAHAGHTITADNNDLFVQGLGQFLMRHLGDSRSP